MPVTSVQAKETLKNFLYDRLEARKREVREATMRAYAQNDYANEIGMNQQTFSRYMRGERSMTLDQATLLLRFFWA